MRRVLGRHSRSFTFVEALVATGLIAGCGLSSRNTIPSEFIQQAEPGVTLTARTTHPDLYQGKIVIVAGTPLAEIQEGDRVWIELKNRPLDANYVPHRPVSRGGPEDGHYWVLVSSHDFPPTSHTWARVTVVGRVLARSLSVPPPVMAEPGPVLAARYIQAWPVVESRAVTWQDHRDPHYMDARGGTEPFQGHCWTCGSVGCNGRIYAESIHTTVQCDPGYGDWLRWAHHRYARHDFLGDPALGLLSKRITQLTVNLNGLSKRMSEAPPTPAESDATLQELRELDRSGWQLHQKQWGLQRDHLVFARDQLEKAQKNSGDKPQLLNTWRQRQQEHQAALEEIYQQGQQLEQKHLEAEARLVERGLQ